MQLVGELLRGRLVVAERLLDDHTRIGRQARLREPLDHPAEEEGRDLEVEDRLLRAVDRLGHPLVGGGIAEIALDVGEPVREPVEHLRVELLAGALDRGPRPLLELVERPVVDGHADDRAVEQTPALEPVQGTEGHHLREISGDSEHDEHVRGPVFA